MSRLSRAGSTVASDDESRPAPGDGIIDMESMLDEALTEIQKRLQKNRSRILPTLQMLRSQDQALGITAGQKRKSQSLPDAGVRQPFHKSYHRLAQLCAEFKAEVISAGTEGRISVEELLLVEKTSRGSINYIFFLGVQCNGDTKWPKHGKDLVHLKSALLMLHDECGFLWSSLEIYKPKAGMALIEWHTWGVYKLCPFGDAKTQIMHRPTSTVAELGVTLHVPRDSVGRVMQKNYGEKDAHVVNGAFQIRCIDCFKEATDTSLWPSQRASERFNTACYRAANADEGSTSAPATPAPRAVDSSPNTSSGSGNTPSIPPPPPMDDLGVPAAQG
eukprot:1019660-Amphidinium_carterae.2